MDLPDTEGQGTCATEDAYATFTDHWSSLTTPNADTSPDCLLTETMVEFVSKWMENAVELRQEKVSSSNMNIHAVKQ